MLAKLSLYKKLVVLLATTLALATPSAQAVQAQSQVLIKAPVERVWSLLIGVNEWPQWNPAIDSVQMTGDSKPGNSFRWKSQGFTVTSTFQEIAPLKRLTWTGAAIGTKAYHTWDLEVTEAGVIVRTHETFDGWLPWLLTQTMQKTLDDTLPRWLATLKTEAEKSTDGAGGGAQHHMQ